jgi:hypothetical protein
MIIDSSIPCYVKFDALDSVIPSVSEDVSAFQGTFPERMLETMRSEQRPPKSTGYIDPSQ